MASVILDERDQQFVLHELLGVESLCEAEPFADFSRDVFDMILSEAQKFATEEILPVLQTGDREGCRLEDGQVKVPASFHRAYRLYCEGGWNAMCFAPEIGGQGLPACIRTAAHDWFSHNAAFSIYPGLGEGAAHLVEVYGTPQQKERYLDKMVSGQWGGAMALTEPGAGTDVGNLSTRARRMPDGSFRIQGTKQFNTSADQDLTENVINPVLARIEGDPAGTGGISIFLVPKYVPNGDGGPGRLNDLKVTKIEEKLGIHGSATCLVNFGDNGECYAELLGEERQGMRVMFQLMNEARIGTAMQGLGYGSIAYLHALGYAKERLQGSSLMDLKDPEAPRVPIIEHPDVRRMLMWMKAHVEAMRALLYYASWCVDRQRISPDEDGKVKWGGLLEVLTPVCKAYCSDMGFRVCETAMQVYGGYGYCAEYPVEQFLRDVKIASIYEGANGIQALDLVGRKLGMQKGAYFMNLLGEMQAVIERYKGAPGLADLASDVQQGVGALGEMALFFGQCGREGRFLVPVSQAYPFLMLMGKVLAAWLLLWEAGVARERLEALSRHRGVDASDIKARDAFVAENRDAAFYAGKILTGRYFIKNVLPEIYGTVAAIRSEDLSVVEMPVRGFAT